MPSYRPGQAEALLGVSTDTVRRWADEGRLKTVRTKGGHRNVDGECLARFLVEGMKQQEPNGIVQSARNSFTGLVARAKLTVMIEVPPVN